jgi:signal transduction histidine kinase
MGLIAAIRKEARELGRNTGMRARLVLGANLPELDDDTELAIYRAVQEALNNIAKHSQAKTFSISLEVGSEQLRLRVEDDGVGFAGTYRSRSFGLFGMRERIAVLGGTVRVRTRAGKGTQIVVSVPITPKPSTAKSHAIPGLKPDIHYVH